MLIQRKGSQGPSQERSRRPELDTWHVSGVPFPFRLLSGGSTVSPGCGLRDPLDSGCPHTLFCLLRRSTQQGFPVSHPTPMSHAPHLPPNTLPVPQLQESVSFLESGTLSSPTGSIPLLENSTRTHVLVHRPRLVPAGPSPLTRITEDAWQLSVGGSPPFLHGGPSRKRGPPRQAE